MKNIFNLLILGLILFITGTSIVRADEWDEFEKITESDETGEGDQEQDSLADPYAAPAPKAGLDQPGQDSKSQPASNPPAEKEEAENVTPAIVPIVNTRRAQAPQPVFTPPPVVRTDPVPTAPPPAQSGGLVDINVSRLISRIDDLERTVDQLKQQNRFQDQQISNVDRELDNINRRKL